mmetsp:Transcript_9805/g.32129  ORF Transcript_9805/g.32129 Transcript_9805/m.32129 type:complete len:258 (+) Transcript_9805:1317-2090(+)
MSSGPPVLSPCWIKTSFSLTERGLISSTSFSSAASVSDSSRVMFCSEPRMSRRSIIARRASHPGPSSLKNTAVSETTSTVFSSTSSAPSRSRADLPKVPNFLFAAAPSTLTSPSERTKRRWLCTPLVHTFAPFLRFSHAKLVESSSTSPSERSFMNGMDRTRPTLACTSSVREMLASSGSNTECGSFISRAPPIAKYPSWSGPEPAPRMMVRSPMSVPIASGLAEATSSAVTAEAVASAPSGAASHGTAWTAPCCTK